HWIEMKARHGSSDSVRELLDIPRRPHLTESPANAIELQALAGCLRAQPASACRSSASRRRRWVWHALPQVARGCGPRRTTAVPQMTHVSSELGTTPGPRSDATATRMI